MSARPRGVNAVMVGKFESGKDSAQEIVESGANTVGHIATIITGAVRDVVGELGGFVTDVIEMREAATKAQADRPHVVADPERISATLDQ